MLRLLLQPDCNSNDLEPLASIRVLPIHRNAVKAPVYLRPLLIPACAVPPLPRGCRIATSAANRLIDATVASRSRFAAAAGRMLRAVNIRALLQLPSPEVEAAGLAALLLPRLRAVR